MPLKVTDSSIKWTSRDKSVATISSDGKVKALKKGKTTIYAKVGSVEDSIQVVVYK